MTPLRQSMIDAMRQRGFSVRTHQSYLDAVTKLTGFFHCSPDQLTVEQLQVFFNYLALERKLSPASCRLFLNGVRFFYLKVLKWTHFDVALIVPKREQRIPELLTRAEVGRLLQADLNPKHRMLLVLCYGCGLRVSELVAVRVRDIDGERRVLRIEQGKGAKDRLVIIGDGLLYQLRRYWQIYRPPHWLFPSSRDPSHHLGITTAQKVYQRAHAAAGIGKVGGIHALRHAYATHQLERGLPVHHLQRLLGHNNLQSTMRYVHWVPEVARQGGAHVDLIGTLDSSDG